MKITMEEYSTFIMEFYEGQERGSVVRLGQAFCNKFDVTDTVLFYSEDPWEISDILFDKYVEEE